MLNLLVPDCRVVVILSSSHPNAHLGIYKVFISLVFFLPLSTNYCVRILITPEVAYSGLSAGILY
jgi:hypothetical protein